MISPQYRDVEFYSWKYRKTSEQHRKPQLKHGPLQKWWGGGGVGKMQKRKVSKQWVKKDSYKLNPPRLPIPIAFPMIHP